jgi:hypothetical protein
LDVADVNWARVFGWNWAGIFGWCWIQMG